MAARGIQLCNCECNTCIKVCLVGAGATGSELMKDFAMCGIGTQNMFNVLVADDDVVERSNLSRQFLYRIGDVGLKKAVCATAAAKALNSDFVARGIAKRVDESTANTFGANCDLTITALDSQAARKFVAQRCQYGFSRPQPCLNLGTEGLKFSTDAIIPHVTTSYARMNPDHSAAAQELNCQERTVPKTIRHCVSFAKRQFELLFAGLPNEEEPLSLLRVRDWKECVVWARMLFEWSNRAWVTDVKRDYEASDTIWQGRALPDVVPFVDSDELVQQFVGAAAVLKAVSRGIEPSRNFAATAEEALHVQPSLDVPSSPEDVDASRSLISHFEKDNDSNCHVDFVAACANLKARMFNIKPAICELLCVNVTQCILTFDAPAA